MEGGGLLVHLVTVLGAALFGAAIALRLRLPLIVGYVLAGILIGPFTPGIVGQADAVSDLAEVGIVLLMFVIGVQLSLKEIVSASRITILGALLQVAIMIAIGFGAGKALGWNTVTAYAFGAVISNSSSTVLGKVLSDRGELASHHTQMSIAWSSVQDLSTVVLIAIFSFGTATDVNVWAQLGKAALFFFVLVPLSFWVLPWLLRQATLFRNREFFALTVVTIALAMAGSASLLGVSLALGAFLTGIVLGESDLAHRILGDTVPLRDVFSGAFFVAIGMLLDPIYLLQSWPLVLLTVGLIVVVKGWLSVALARMLGASTRLAILMGAALAQSGEFSFLMSRVALDQGAMPIEVFNLLLSATIMTVLLAPAVNALAPVVLRWAKAQRDTESDNKAPATTQTQHAVVCGYGRVGSIVCTLLEQHGKPFTVVEEDVRIVDSLRARGVAAVLGDAGMPSVLERAGVRSAQLLVLSIPERMAVRSALDYARDVNADIAVLARTHSFKDRQFLENKGADIAVVGELELALELGRRALERFDVGVEDVEASVGDVRRSLTA